MATLHQIALQSESSASEPAGGLNPSMDPAARRHMALVMLGSIVNSSGELTNLLDDAAALAASALEVEFFGVAELGKEPQSLTFRLGKAGANGTGSDISDHPLAAETNQSAVSYSLKVNHPVVFANLDKDTRFDDSIISHKKISSGIVCPIKVGKRSSGTVAVFSTAIRAFSREEVQFVKAVAQLLGPTFARDKAGKALAEQSQFLAASMDTMDAMVLLLTTEGKIIRMNRACQEATGFSPQEVRQRHIWSVMLIPEDVSLMQNTFELLRRGKTPIRFESFILTKHGEKRRVSWSYTDLRDEHGAISSFVGTGVDITKQHEALEKLERAEEEVEQLQRKLDELREDIANSELESILSSRFQVAGRKSKSAENDERRDNQRRPYPYIQITAPWHGDELPQLKDFGEVRCHDISPGGFSYLVEGKPDYDKLVVAFGSTTAKIHLSAQVMHVTPFSHDGRNMQLVGCKYTGRVKI